MDGRVQLPVITFLQRELGVEFVDSITEPGPVRMLAERSDSAAVGSILRRVAISQQGHKSRAVAVVVVAHHDCAGNPADEDTQRRQLTEAVDFLSTTLAGMSVMGIWVGRDWSVSVAERREPKGPRGGP